MRADESLRIETLASSSGARIMKLTGPLTLQSLFDFQDAVREDREKPILLDVSGVEYMDSAGLGSVIGTFTSCEASNRGFAITGLNDRIRTLFAVTHVDGLLPCFDSLEAADKSLQN